MTRRDRHASPDETWNVTGAPEPLSRSIDRRTTKYLASMAFRTACFVTAVLVTGWWRWLLVGIAVVLPYLAVLIANAGRGRMGSPSPAGEPPIDRVMSNDSDEVRMVAPDMQDAEDGQDDGGELICSARRCRNQAVWALKWNNPKLHTPDRRKIWLACDEHLDRLSDFLDDRGFLVETVPVGELAEG